MASLVGAALFLLIWGQAAQAPYHYDDYITPLQDPASQGLSAWGNNIAQTLRPLTKLTYALESSLGITSAPARRVSSTLLGLITLVIFLNLLWKKTQHWGLSLTLALIWALHPVQSENLISLAGRSTLLATLFIALSVNSEKFWRRLFFAICAVLSKEVALLYLLWTLFTEWQRSQDKRKILGTLALFIAIVGIIMNERLLLLINYSLTEVTYIVRWWEGPAGISAGLVYLLLPFKVGIEVEFPWMISALWFFVTVILVGLVLWLYRRTQASALILWLCLILPTQSLIPKLDPLSLRSLGFSLLALPLIFVALVPSRLWSKSLIFLIPFVVICGTSSFHLARAYRDPVALWRDASEKTKKKTRPLVNLSYFLVREDQYQEAKSALEEAQRRDPRNVDVRERLKSLTYLMETFNR